MKTPTLDSNKSKHSSSETKQKKKQKKSNERPKLTGGTTNAPTASTAAGLDVGEPLPIMQLFELPPAGSEIAEQTFEV